MTITCEHRDYRTLRPHPIVQHTHLLLPLSKGMILCSSVMLAGVVAVSSVLCDT
jgi:hypothetical protein